MVRDAFIALGHDAWSCDIKKSESWTSRHIQGDVLDVLTGGWDMMIAHPPCTYLSYAGQRWLKNNPPRQRLLIEAADFAMRLMSAPVPMIALENPRGHLTSLLGRASQVVNPCDFGDPYKKCTHLWLKNLPPLMSTMRVTNPIKNWTTTKVHSAADPSRTPTGMARAMAEQWGRC